MPRNGCTLLHSCGRYENSDHYWDCVPQCRLARQDQFRHNIVLPQFNASTRAVDDGNQGWRWAFLDKQIQTESLNQALLALWIRVFRSQSH